MNKLLVIMPVFNREMYVKESIESIIKQTYQNFELVIVDDCSTDNSLHICQEYKSNNKITILKNDVNRGCYYSRNLALDYFKDKEWDIFTVHDSDDVSYLNRFEEILSEFDETILGIRPLCLQVNEKLQFIQENGLNKSSHAEGVSFFKRNVFDEILGYYDNTRFGGDSDYWHRLERYCKRNPPNRVKRSNKPLYLRRVHSTQLTKTYNWNTHRKQYALKFQNDILEMNKTGNFYRNKFN